MNILGSRTERIVRKSAAFGAHLSGYNAIANHFQRVRHGPKLVVLAYHRVNDCEYDSSPYTVTPAQLEKHLEIVGRKFRVVGLSEALEMASERDTAVDSAIITFDDGYLDNFEKAAPILERHGMTACFFLTTGLLDPDDSRLRDGGGKDPYSGMAWSHVRQLLERDFEIGAHTCFHPTLLDLPLAAAQEEIMRSKERIEEETGTPVRFFAYPGGKRHVHHDESTRKIVEGVFDACCTTDRGRNHIRSLRRYEIQRICVQRWWTPYYFSRELEGTFDFVGHLTVSTRMG